MKENNKGNNFGKNVRIARKVKNRMREVERQREKQGKEPWTEEQRKRYIKGETKKELRKSKIRAVIVALVGTNIFSVGTTALLNEKNSDIKKSNNEISIDVKNKDKDVKIKNMPDDKNIFINGIKVNTEELKKKEEEDNELVNNVKKDIESLETKEEILNYVKDIFVDEYNKQNNDNINRDQITFYKTRESEYVYQDEAENGDMILKSEYVNDKDKKYIDTAIGVITAKINKGEATFYEKIMNYNNKIQTVYGYNKTAEKYEDNVLVKVGDVVDKGIDWSTAIEQEENDWSVNNKYKQRFIDAVKEYKERQIEEIRQPRINSDYEIE